MDETADDVRTEGAFDGAPVADNDIRALLEQEQRATAALKAQLEEARGERARAQSQAQTAHLSQFEAQELAVKSRLEAAEAEAKSLKRAYAEALAEGRFDETAELQDKLAELRARQMDDRRAETWLANEKMKLRAAPPPQQQGLDLSQYTAGQRKWIRENPDFMTDPDLRSRTMTGHQLAVAEGYEIDSPEYFDVINDVVFHNRRAVAEPPAARKRAEITHEMPVTRRTAQQSERGPKQFRLSADQMEAADMTMPDVPAEGHKDPSGRWIPGRYERYVINSQKLRAREGRT